MKNYERIKYLSKKYFDRTITKEEWEEVLWRLGRAEVPENIDILFRDEWMRTNLTHNIPHVTWEDLKSRMNSGKNQKPVKKVKFLWRWAAAAAVIVLISSIWLTWGQEQNLLTYETGFGETEEILLDDGTLVTLNANSTLIWDKDWTTSGMRSAELQGEAYFDVSHIDTITNGEQKNIPFNVQTPDLVVNVLGTAFNVSNRRGETDVFLERGLVKLVLGDGKNNANLVSIGEDGNESLGNITKDEVMMKPGDQVSYSTMTNVIKKGGNNSDLGWKNGALTFQKIEFGVILAELEDLYGKRFEVKDKALLSRKVVLSVPYENWETVYKLIEVTLNLEIIEDYDKNIVTIKNRKG